MVSRLVLLAGGGDFSGRILCGVISFTVFQVCVRVRACDRRTRGRSFTHSCVLSGNHFLASQVLVRGGNRITMPLACIGIVGEKRQKSICFTLHCSLYIDFWFFEYGAMFFLV